MLDLVTAGEAFDDFIFHGLTRLPKPGEEIKTSRFSRSSGGGAVITAIAAARLGIRCGVVSGLSRESARLLRSEGVSVTNLRKRSEPPALTVALSMPADRAFVTFNGVNDRLPVRLRRALTRIRARHVHMAFYPPRCRPWVAVIERLRRRGVTTSWDFGWNPPLRADRAFDALAAAVDYLFVNQDEAMLYSGTRRIADALAHWRRSQRPVIVKLGGSGSRAVADGIDIRAGALRARVVDTTGAGDAFNGGFLAAILRRRDLSAALRLGNRVGALSTERAGGIAGLPRRGRAVLAVQRS
jgi:sugar/nucleoside kinase (ribokinase family)